MKATGIIVEYNPFHYGHLYHIEKSRELTGCDVLIAVMSGNFVQRGEPALIDKWQRTKTALENGVDLVIELPFAYCNQSAQQFAEGAIKILDLSQVSNIVFGSESNNIFELQEIADMSINVNNLRESMRSGIGFPKAYGLMAGEYFPNDILGIAYLKALKGTNIQPHTIQRTVHYNDPTLDKRIVSAKAIRNGIFNDKDISLFTPMKIDKNNVHTLESYYPYIRSLLLTLDQQYLSELFLFNEGIENHLIKQARLADDFTSFIDNCVTKRYSKARIQRTLISLICQIKKTDIANLPEINALRVLGFNTIGQTYLKELKKKDVKIATRFNQIPEPYRIMEYKTTNVYYYFSQHQREAVMSEITTPVIIK